MIKTKKGIQLLIMTVVFAALTVSGCSSRSSDSVSNIHTLESDIISLKNDINSLKSQITDLEVKNSSLEGKLKSVENDVNSLGYKVR